jgi:hypothetical protein
VEQCDVGADEGYVEVMSDFERDYVIVYHWSPSTRRAAIERDGLRIGAEPAVNAVEGSGFLDGEPGPAGHRNECISVSPTPTQAWWLSGEALEVGGFPSESPTWDLYEVNIAGLDYDRRGDDFPELKVREGISADRVTWIASRPFESRHENPSQDELSVQVKPALASADGIQGCSASDCPPHQEGLVLDAGHA